MLHNFLNKAIIMPTNIYGRVGETKKSYDSKIGGRIEASLFNTKKTKMSDFNSNRSFYW